MSELASILLLPLLAGLATALLAGPLGCFVVWQRMAYFGESLSHSALLGVAIALWLNLSPTPVVIGVGALLACALAYLQQTSRLGSDTLLGILAHTLLAAGLVLLSTLPNLRVNIEAMLFGDLLSVAAADVYLLGGLLAVAALALKLLWQPLIAMTLHQELAQAEGIKVNRVRLSLMLLMALTVACAMKVVGVLLITALLVIPAATAQRLAKSPEQMALGAAAAGSLAVIGGLSLSWQTNSPVGPAIILLAGAMFFLAQALTKLLKRD